MRLTDQRQRAKNTTDYRHGPPLSIFVFRKKRSEEHFVFFLAYYLVGGAWDHFAEQFPVLEPPKPPAVIFQPRAVCPAMSGIIKVIVSFFRKGEGVAIERHRSRVPVDKDKHTTRVFEFKKHQTKLSSYKFCTFYGAQSLKTT